MAKAADIGSKRLIGLAPDAWVQWVTQQPDVVAREILSAEFQWLSRDSDALIRAHSPTMGDFLVLIEVQLYIDRRMPVRVNAYAGLAEEKYHLPVFPVVINILPHPSTEAIVDYYERTFLGLFARREYRVINLWEIEAEIAFQPSLRPLLPFVPILRGGGEEQVVRKAVRFLRDDEELCDMETLLAFFASFVFETRTIQQIMRWDMIVLENSPWYQEILERGIQKGLEQKTIWYQEGLLEGRQEGQQELLQRILQRRFGEVPPDVLARLKAVAAHQIEAVIDAALLTNSLNDFLAQLPTEPDTATSDPTNN